MSLTVKRLKEVLYYSDETGKFYWKSMTHKNSSMIKAGKIAGWENGWRNGRQYSRICIDQKSYYTHRLVWLYFNSKWPEEQLDHIDGDTFNNKISNLREATRSQNKANCGVYKCTKSGYKGAYKSKNKWISTIRINNRLIYLGRFDTPQQANKAYSYAACKYHGEYSRSS